LKGKAPEELIAGIMEKIETFAEGMPQADDITMLTLRYIGERG